MIASLNPVGDGSRDAGRASSWWRTPLAGSFGGSRSHALEVFSWLVLFALVVNTLAYVLSASSPLLISDAWYFLDVFIRKALDHTLHLADFFVKRSNYDHAQPLRKLILLFELRYFDLDFRIEAVIGLFCAAGSALVLRLIVMADGASHRGLKSLIWCGICVALISLNSRTLWTWPLVTSAYTSYLLMFLLFYGMSQWLDKGRAIRFFMFALLLDLAADDSALLVTVACSLTLLLVAARGEGQYRRRAIVGVIGLLLVLLMVRLLYKLLSPPLAPMDHHLGAQLGLIFKAFFAGGWHSWVVIPLASSIAYLPQLQTLVGGAAGAVQTFLALGLLAAHVWFWWRAWRNPLNAPTLSGVAMMLTFYAMCAGIIFARVPVFGSNYLSEPRYVLIYDFGIVALLLMCAGCDWKASPMWARSRVILGALACTFVLWQVPLSRRAWGEVPYISAYNQNVAAQMGELARDPSVVPADCSPQIVICSWPAAKRADLIGLLQSHHLNVFSTAFQRSTRFYPVQIPEQTR